MLPVKRYLRQLSCTKSAHCCQPKVAASTEDVASHCNALYGACWCMHQLVHFRFFAQMCHPGCLESCLSSLYISGRLDHLFAKRCCDFRLPSAGVDKVFATVSKSISALAAGTFTTHKSNLCERISAAPCWICAHCMGSLQRQSAAKWLASMAGMYAVWPG